DGDLRLLTIIGIVGDARNHSLEAPPSPTVYVNYRQRPQSSDLFTIVMRTSLPPEGVISTAREIVHSVDPDVPPQFRTFAQVFISSLATRRFNLTLILAFAGAALLLAVAGIYGVMAYSVTRRTREIGVRIALGAARGDVLRLVLGQGLWTTAIGVAIGIAGSLALTRTMQSLLFGVSPTDALTLVAVSHPPLPPPMAPRMPPIPDAGAPPDEEYVAVLARVAAILKSRLFFESSVPAPTSVPSAGIAARKFSASSPVGAMCKLVVIFSMSKSWPVFRPVSAEIVDILDPRSKPASLALYSPTVPVVISLLVGPVIFRFVLSAPAATEAPFGRWMPSAGRKASRSRAGMFSPSTFALTMVASPGDG